MYLHPSLKSYFSTTSSLFEQIMALKGIVYRNKEGRLTQQIQLGVKTYFIKQHRGVGLKELVKNLLQGRLPVFGAKNEWLALQKLERLGVRVPKVFGFGARGLNPLRQQSFILMEALTTTISLEDYCQAWRTVPPAFATKAKLVTAVAIIASLLREAGMNHRDFYICHFLLDTAAKDDFPQLYLIDLHRAQIRTTLPLRWQIKDLAGLYFSSKALGLTKHDYYRFMKAYQGKPLRVILAENQGFWEKVRNRGEELYREHDKLISV